MNGSPAFHVAIPAQAGIGGRWRFMPAILLAALLCLALPAPSRAQVASNTAPLQFQDAAEEARFHALAATLRCVQCQNQSLADSDAPIAHDLRRVWSRTALQLAAEAERRRSTAELHSRNLLDGLGGPDVPDDRKDS